MNNAIFVKNDYIWLNFIFGKILKPKKNISLDYMNHGYFFYYAQCYLKSVYFFFCLKAK